MVNVVAAPSIFFGHSLGQYLIQSSCTSRSRRCKLTFVARAQRHDYPHLTLTLSSQYDSYTNLHLRYTSDFVTSQSGLSSFAARSTRGPANHPCSCIHIRVVAPNMTTARWDTDSAVSIELAKRSKTTSSGRHWPAIDRSALGIPAHARIHSITSVRTSGTCIELRISVVHFVRKCVRQAPAQHVLNACNNLQSNCSTRTSS